ncbi:MAG: CopG family transcriptional regulator [Candidatus Bathyarchaeia archaeon]
MSETVSFKVPKSIKGEMEKLKGEIDWPEELRKFVIERIERVRRERALNEVLEDLRRLGPAGVPLGFSWKSVRGDRDSH